jgi:hypothetical protein
LPLLVLLVVIPQRSGGICFCPVLTFVFALAILVCIDTACRTNEPCRQPQRAKLPRMKPLLESLTPTQLLWITAAANTLVVIGFGVLSAPSWHKGLHLVRWYPLAALVFGLVGSLVVEQVLRNGISSDRWPEKLLEAPREFVASPGYPVLCGLLILGSLAYMVFSSAHQVSGTWMFLAPLQSLIRVGTYLRPKPASDRLFRPIEQLKPLQSENWGSPPRPFSS